MLDIIREDVRSFAGKIDALSAKLDSRIDALTASMVRRDELAQLQSKIGEIVPRAEHETQWKRDEQRHQAIDLTLDGLKRGRFDERLLTIENVMLPMIGERVGTLEKNGFPPWLIPMFGIFIAAASVIVPHFWK